jgi:nitroreductase/NAD-dependent dihydropyrimidine dehydrogenase PreA subunit
MENQTPPVRINEEACIGCGRCADVCPVDTLGMENGKARVIGARCIACGHCAAVCGPAAILVEGIDPHSLDLKTLQVPATWLPYGQGNAAELVRLMRSRRSCRHYTEQAVDRTVLEDLVRIGTSAPSATNSQTWTFTALPTRSAVEALAADIGRFFKRLNRAAANPLIRGVLALLGKPELSAYYRRQYASVQRKIAEWEESGRDPLFHEAPAVIVIASRPGGAMPQDDALLATQNILLAAHAMGLGTCLIGYAVAAMQRDPAIQKNLGIPAEETVHSVIALGHPAGAFARCAGRKPLTLRWAKA